ncbi:hypothetical protein AB1Y20_010409 [Prymnesium parvum]|uniref:Integrin alpha-2 domain-containing protein n=1 Tax=Prymnesium parvum TaxID=97485 RepID=A0AB34IRB7_PRYPA
MSALPACWLAVCLASSLQTGQLATPRLTGGEAGLPPAASGRFGAAEDVREDNTLAVGAIDADDFRGAVWLIALRPNGTAASYALLHNGSEPSEGGAALSLAPYAYFGCAVAWLNDVDGDGNADLAVGAQGQSGAAGGVYVCFLNADLSLKRFVSFREGEGGFLDGKGHTNLGRSLAAMPGLLEADEAVLAVGAASDYFTSDGVRVYGTVFIVSLFPNGTVRRSPSRIHAGSSGFESATPLDFGLSLARIPDMDSPADGVAELAVGAQEVEARSGFRGAVYVLRLASNATVRFFSSISYDEIPTLSTSAFFGATSITALPDLDWDGAPELAASTRQCQHLLFCGGSVVDAKIYVLYLNSNGTYKQDAVLSFDGLDVGTSGQLGSALSVIQAPADNYSQGEHALLVGTEGDSSNQGSVYLLTVRGEPAPSYAPSPPPTLPPPVAPPPSAPPPPSLLSRVYMFNFTKSRSNEYLQLQEIRLYADDASTPVSINEAAHPYEVAPSTQSADKAIDGCLTGGSCKWFAREFPTLGYSTLLLTLATPQVVAGYSLMTGNDNSQRDPVSWTFWRLLDSGSWLLMDQVDDFVPPDARETWYTASEPSLGFKLYSPPPPPSTSPQSNPAPWLPPPTPPGPPTSPPTPPSSPPPPLSPPTVPACPACLNIFGNQAINNGSTWDTCSVQPDPGSIWQASQAHDASTYASIDVTPVQSCSMVTAAYSAGASHIAPYTPVLPYATTVTNNRVSMPCLP